MKEIDFLPEWYRSGRRREVRYRTQYIALSTVFAIMILWNLVASRSISKTATELALAKSQAANIESASLQFTEIQNRLEKLQKKAQFIKEIESKINVANVLAELSFLIGEKVVLSKVELIAEKFVDGHKARPKYTSTVRVADRDFSGRQTYRRAGIGDARFRVVIRGIASDASDVAELICRLEDSPYFRNVFPAFSRNTEINTKINSATGRPFKAEVSEFEIGCYLANYHEN